MLKPFISGQRSVDENEIKNSDSNLSEIICKAAKGYAASYKFQRYVENGTRKNILNNKGVLGFYSSLDKGKQRWI
ncbi:hypothetical protein F3H66_15195 [Serratia marcescens]|uniref:hypothetical protein n=1 Tax=Serratia marcescens TaxID=615 RepID=UPI001880A5A8|nr:hypothetical protein [Serratia marcescens]MBE8814880.1 hypothetical protein [Serratia marcescens]